MRTLFIVTGIIAALAGLGVGVYFFFLQPQGPVENGAVFDPFGNVVSDPRDTETPETPGFVIDGEPRQGREKITQIHPDPVAGSAFFSQEIEVSTTTTINSREVYFAEKQTGNVFAYSVDTGEVERISNTTFPGVQNVYWFENPEELLFEYVNDDRIQEIYSAQLVDGGLEGTFLPREIESVLPVASSTLLGATIDAGGVVFSFLNTRGEDENTLFETDLREVRLASANESTFSFFTTPASFIKGAFFSVGIGGTQERILGGINGLTVLPNDDLSFVIFSSSVRGGLNTSVLTTETGETRALPLTTLPEKCTWDLDQTTAYCMVPQTIPAGNYPDYWYQGRVHFTDALWRIDVERGTARALSFFDEEGPIDGIKLQLSNEGDYLTFINKRDDTLWGFEI